MFTIIFSIPIMMYYCTTIDVDYDMIIIYSMNMNLFILIL